MSTITTITTMTSTGGSPAVADRQEAERERAALRRLAAAVAALRAWRQLAPPPTRLPTGAPATTGRGR